MMKKLFTPRNLCLSALIAAVYAVLTLALPVLTAAARIMREMSHFSDGRVSAEQES